MVFVDISGFTKLSERLARKGKEGAEQVTEAIERCFTELLVVAYANGGGLLKFGGDALLLFFDGPGHALRAAASAVGMRTTLRTVGRINIPRAKIQLRMSVGAHSGTFHFFLVGESHREMIVTGPAWTRTVEMEHEAVVGQIRVSREMAAFLPEECLGLAEGPGVLLIREPPGVEQLSLEAGPRLAGDVMATCLSPPLRAHVAAGGGAPEHRPVVTAFLRFGGTDEMLAEQGAAAVADSLHELVARAQSAIDEQGVCFLGSDVDGDGGKLIFTSGAPTNTGSDEERMLLALRRIADGEGPIPFGIGVNRGDVFAGDIGPWYRRTYTVMGDDVNLAARLMAEAGAHEIYATADVLERSDTRFETKALPPFQVKGKTQPVHAWSVAGAVGSRAREATTLDRFPLVGRDDEMQALTEALEQRGAGDGRLIDIVGEPGIGKTRLLEELRDRSEGLLFLRATCEAYTASTPYAVWRELLRELLDLGWEDADDVVLDRVYMIVSTRDPDLLPWLPLVLLPMDVEVPATPEVEMLGEDYLRPRLHESLARFLEIVLDEPTLFEIEDVHHMDDASAMLLRFLVEHLEGHPWLFCVTRRQAERGFVGPDTPLTRVIEPRALEPQESLRLAEAAAELHPLPPHVLVTVAERSGGNPQFLQDLVLAAVESGGAQGLPDSVEAAAMARIDRLAPNDRALVRRASVLGVSLHPRTLEWVLDEDTPMPDEHTWERLSEFFEEEGDGFIKFRRALLRDAAYEGLPFRLRRSLHASVAVHMQEEPGGGDDQVDALSLHTFLAERYDEAWRYGRAAGDLAREKAAPAEAAGFYRRALDAARASSPDTVPESQFATVMEGLGEMLLRAGELDEAPRALAEARRMHTNDPVAQARLLLREAYVAERVGRADLVVRRANRVAAALQAIDSQEAAELRAQAAVSLAAARQIQGRTADAVRLSEEAVARAKEASDRKAVADAYLVMDWSLLELGRADEATHLQEALDNYEAVGDRHSVASVYNAMGGVAYFQGRWGEAVELYERMVEMKERLGDPVHAANGLLNVAEVLSDQGRWDEAEERLRRVLRIARGAKEELLVAYATAYLGRAASRGGRGDEAHVLLSDGRDALVTQGADREVEQVDSWLAEAALLSGQWQAAAEAAEALTGVDGASGALLHRVRGLALARMGDPAGAAIALEESLRLADEEGSAFERATTEHILAELWPDDPDADAHRKNAEALEQSLGVVRIAMPSP